MAKTLYVIAGPNGCGKSTLASELVPEFGIPFFNADDMERELTVNQKGTASRMAAGRQFLNRIRHQARQEESFAFETTLSGCYVERVLRDCRDRGFGIVLIYIFLESPQEAIERIRLRVRQGGHHVPDEDVVRRWDRSRRNFWNLYRQLADQWKLYFNGEGGVVPVALGRGENINVSESNLLDLFKGKMA